MNQRTVLMQVTTTDTVAEAPSFTSDQMDGDWASADYNLISSATVVVTVVVTRDTRGTRDTKGTKVSSLNRTRTN